MRIALISELFYPYVKGGVERRYWEIAKRISKNHEVHVFTMLLPGICKEEVIGNIKIHRTCSFGSLYDKHGRRRIKPAVTFAWTLLKRLTEERNRYDLIDCSAFPYIPCYPVKLFSKIQGVPLIITLHEVWADYWHEYLGNWFTALIGKIIEHYTVKLPDFIIAVSNLTANRLTNRLRVDPNRITVIPNGVDFKLFEGTKVEKQPYKILYVGRLISHKHVDSLIEAFAIVRKVFPKASLHIIGDGPERYFLEKLVSKLGLSNQVIFYGTLSRYENVAEQMKSASVFVLPSTREGFSMAVLESMASSTPVIVVRSQYNAALELVHDNENGIVLDHGNSKAIAKAIIHLFEDRGLRERLGENARKLSECLSWEAVATKIEGIYKLISEQH